MLRVSTKRAASSSNNALNNISTKRKAEYQSKVVALAQAAQTTEPADDGVCPSPVAAAAPPYLHGLAASTMASLQIVSGWVDVSTSTFVPAADALLQTWQEQADAAALHSHKLISPLASAASAGVASLRTHLSGSLLSAAPSLTAAASLTQQGSQAVAAAASGGVLSHTAQTCVVGIAEAMNRLDVEVQPQQLLRMSSSRNSRTAAAGADATAPGMHTAAEEAVPEGQAAASCFAHAQQPSSKTGREQKYRRRHHVHVRTLKVTMQLWGRSLSRTMAAAA